MRVKNLNGSSVNTPKPTCKCRTWLEHWKNNRVWEDGKKYNPVRCRSCNEKFEGVQLNGAHVIKVSSSDKTRYIVPLCDSCHGKVNEIYEVKEVDLVSANCSECKNK